jgi:hypothetical protein
MWIAISNAIGQRVGTGGGPGPDPGYTPPLDAYPATAAYSVRKLSSSYSGSAIEAYRVSDGATQDIGFDSNGLVSTSEITTFASGSIVRVQTWYDQSGNSLDASESTPSQMPIIYDGSSIIQLNGTTAVEFSQSAQSQLGTINSTLFTDGNAMVIITYARTGGSGSQTIWDLEEGGQIGRYTFGSVGDLFLWYGQSGQVAGQGTYAAGPGPAEIIGAGRGPTTNAYLYRNAVLQGASATSSSVTTPKNTAAYIGSRVGTQQWPSALIQEIIHYGFDNSVNRLNVESNVNDYYQIANLPATTGFLADYPDAAAAYSVRQLSNNAIKCMRVRRAVPPYDEKDIGFTAGGDLDEAAIVAFGGSDELRVSAWYDQSGQSNHATQITPGSQPQIYNGTAVITENGKPAISWSSNEMDWTISGNANSFSVFTVATNDATSGNQMQYTLSSSPRWWHWYLSGNKTFYYDNTTINHSSVDTNQHLFAKIAGSTLGHAGYWVDNVKASTTGTLNSSAFNTDQRLGNYSSGTNNYWDGTMQELVMWPTDQSSNRTGIETNIMTYFNIP